MYTRPTTACSPIMHMCSGCRPARGCARRPQRTSWTRRLWHPRAGGRQAAGQLLARRTARTGAPANVASGTHTHTRKTGGQMHSHACAGCAPVPLSIPLDGLGTAFAPAQHLQSRRASCRAAGPHAEPQGLTHPPRPGERWRGGAGRVHLPPGAPTPAAALARTLPACA